MSAENQPLLSEIDDSASQHLPDNPSLQNARLDPHKRQMECSAQVQYQKYSNSNSKINIHISVFDVQLLAILAFNLSITYMDYTMLFVFYPEVGQNKGLSLLQIGIVVSVDQVCIDFNFFVCAFLFLFLQFSWIVCGTHYHPIL